MTLNECQCDGEWLLQGGQYYSYDRRQVESVFLSGQASLSGGFQMSAGSGLQVFPAGLAAFLGGLAAFLGGLQAVLGGLSLNRIFCSKDSLLPLLRKSPKYET